MTEYWLSASSKGVIVPSGFSPIGLSNSSLEKEIKEREHLEKIEDIKGVQMEIGWGSQIRSYVFMPYTMVKDHRTNYESSNPLSVLDGNIDGFIHAYLKMNHIKGE